MRPPIVCNGATGCPRRTPDIEHLAECKLEWVIPGLQFGYAVIWLVTCPDVIVNGVWVSVQACFDETADRVQWCYGLPPPAPGGWAAG